MVTNDNGIGKGKDAIAQLSRRNRATVRRNGKIIPFPRIPFLFIQGGTGSSLR